MRPTLLLLVLALLSGVATAEEPSPLRSYTSERYEFSTDETREFATAALALLQAAWPQMKAFFGAEPRQKPGERLRIRYLTTRTAWEAAMLADGVRPPSSAGGYYAPANRTAYVYRQPTVYNSRQLLLHEAMHQFHFLACCNNVGPKDIWYLEGLVEHLSRHTWDGTTLTLGVVPTVSLANYPSRAREVFAKPDFDLTKVVSGERKFSRVEAWTLVRYLATSQDVSRQRWKKLRRMLDGGRSASQVFQKLIGSPKKMQPRIVEWLKTQQEPLHWIWNEWQGVGPRGVEGWSDVTTAAHVHEGASAISCRIDYPSASPWKAGLLLHYMSNKDYTVALVKSGGAWTINRRIGSGWTVLLRGSLEEPLPNPFQVKAVRDGSDGTTVSFAVQGRVVATVTLPAGKLGIALEACRAKFLDLAWD